MLNKKTISIIILIIALFYDISPVDIVPDITPIMGFADDFFVTLTALINLYFKWRKK